MNPSAPPPTYEAVTGLTGADYPRPLYYTSAGPSSYDDLKSYEKSRTPILPKVHTSPRTTTTYTLPYNPISYPATRPTPQTNHILRRQQSKENSKKCIYFFLTIVLMFILIMVMVVVIRSRSTKAKFYSVAPSSYDTHNEHRPTWVDNWWKDNQKQLDEMQQRHAILLQQRRDESQWNFNTNRDNNN